MKSQAVVYYIQVSKLGSLICNPFKIWLSDFNCLGYFFDDFLAFLIRRKQTHSKFSVLQKISGTVIANRN